MANEFDMTCPECGCDDQLDVAATVWARVTESGTDADESHDGSHEWDGHSACHCAACGWAGVAGDAMPDDDEAPPIVPTAPAAPIAAIDAPPE